MSGVNMKKLTETERIAELEKQNEKLQDIRNYVLTLETHTEEGKRIVDIVFEKSGGL